MTSWNTDWKSQLFAAGHLFLATLPNYSWETSFWSSLRHFWTTSPRGSSPSYLCKMFSELPVLLAQNLISVQNRSLCCNKFAWHKHCTTSFAPQIGKSRLTPETQTPLLPTSLNSWKTTLIDRFNPWNFKQGSCTKHIETPWQGETCCHDLDAAFCLTFSGLLDRIA